TMLGFDIPPQQQHELNLPLAERVQLKSDQDGLKQLYVREPGLGDVSHGGVGKILLEELVQQSGLARADFAGDDYEAVVDTKCKANTGQRCLMLLAQKEEFRIGHLLEGFFRKSKMLKVHRRFPRS